MAIHVIYKEKYRSFCQTQVDDWFPGLLAVYYKRHRVMQEWRWQLKKEYYEKLPEFIRKTKPRLRRGALKKDYPTRKAYRMDIPYQVRQIEHFKWFAPCWHKDRQEAPPSLPKNQTTLNRWLIDPFISEQTNKHVVVPRFRKPRVVDRDEFCSDITNLGWNALRRYHDSPACLFYIFYLNDFSVIDDEALLRSSQWREIGAYLASDIVKYELTRLLLGFVTFTDYFRMMELFPSFEDHLAIAMARHPPSGDRLVKALRIIGVSRIRHFHEALKLEFRALGLIKDKVWLWDGQFFEVWMKQERKKDSRDKTELFGGWYNHGGKKRGFGIVQSTIVDWSGFVPIPITIRVYPANTNDNIMFRDTFADGLKENPKTTLFLDTDKGPSSYESINQVHAAGIIPVMALGENRTRNVVKTKEKEYKFDSSSTEGIDARVLEMIYMMRTRIEEIFAAIKVVFKQARLHGTGQDFLEIEVILINIAIMLIALTAFKIGRPDLAWKPTAFNNLKLHPEHVFPERMKELIKLRWNSGLEN